MYSSRMKGSISVAGSLLRKFSSKMNHRLKAEVIGEVEKQQEAARQALM